MKYFKNLSFGFMLLYLCTSVAFGLTVKEQLRKALSLYKSKEYDQAIPYFENVVEILKKSNQRLVAQEVQINLANIYLIQGKNDLALKELEIARDLYSQPKPKTRINLYSKLATAHHNLKHYAGAAQILEELLASGVALTPAQKADLQAKLADAYRRSEIHTKAIMAYAKALKFYEREKNTKKRILILNGMGLSYNKLGDFSNAIISLEKSLSIASDINNPRSLAEANSNLGIVYWDKGEYSRALRYIARAKEVEKKFKLKRNLGVDFNNEGLIYKSVGKYNEGLSSIEKSIQIAREVKNIKDEAIAWSNFALVKRIQGQNDEAFEGYQKALNLYKKERFQEGMASCYMGLGKLYEIRDLNYQLAYDNYQKAYKIYKSLGNLGYQAEALNQIGRVLKKGIDRKRTTRDLLFEDESPTFIDMPPAQAVTESIAAYKKALKLGKMTVRREVVWSALQGLGFALKEQGKLEEAFSRYKAAVDTVIKIRGGNSDSELMADYLRDKEDLFTEAMEVSGAMFDKTNEEKYLRYQMEYQEIYKNEVMKNAMRVANLKFEDPGKNKLADQMNGLLARAKKVNQLESQYQSSLSQENGAKNKRERVEQEKKRRLKQNALKSVQSETKKIESSFKELLIKWRQKYPGDADLFDSAAEIDFDVIQSKLGQDEAIIQYMPLGEELNIVCITNESIVISVVEVPYNELARIIRDDLMYENIELYGHQNTDLSEEESYNNIIAVLNYLYEILVDPIADSLIEKSKLIIVTSKYLSYVPFSALAQSNDTADPQFLIRDYSVSYTRLTFFNRDEMGSGSTRSNSTGRIIGVGNPVHKYLAMRDLDGADEEIDKMGEVARNRKMKTPTVMIQEAATETAWKKEVASKSYSVMYFATHAVPFAEIYFMTKEAKGLLVENKNKLKTAPKAKHKEIKKKINRLSNFIEFSDKTFTTKSPLYSFLYMAYSGSEKDDGVLTLKEILEMPESCFSNARLAVLSACNTAVTYSPKIKKGEREELENDRINQELVDAGFIPGVDQVSLTDTFMKRNFKSILGTLWFADDQATGFIVGEFFNNIGTMKPAVALRQAKLDYLENPPLDPDHTEVPLHPYYWAVSAIFGE
jgi:CHAT domain-containing protein